MRTFARLITVSVDNHCVSSRMGFMRVAEYVEGMTYGELMEVVHQRGDTFLYNVLHTPMALSEPLQDLADELQEDIAEAAEAWHAERPYPGVAEYLDEPLPDARVAPVIAAMQIALDKERRDGRPPFALAAMPFAYQRGIAERRRLRYQQWGISEQVRARGTWSVWDVPEDPEWIPRRAVRGRGRGA